jgi:hypothetical protein
MTDSTPTDITALLDQWIRLDILVPVAEPNRFEAECADPRLSRLRREAPLNLCLESWGAICISNGWPLHSGCLRKPPRHDDLARQLRLLDMRVRDAEKAH